MDEIELSLQELKSVISNFPVGADKIYGLKDGEFPSIEAYNIKKGEFLVNSAYKESKEFPINNTHSTVSEVMKDYLKEKYIKECRYLGLRGMVEMLSLDGVGVEVSTSELERKLLKLASELDEDSSMLDEIKIESLYEEVLAKEKVLHDLVHKFQEALVKLKEKRQESPDDFSINERSHQKNENLLKKINFMRMLTVNLVGAAKIDITENEEICKKLLEKCQPLQLEDITK